MRKNLVIKPFFFFISILHNLLSKKGKSLTEATVRGDKVKKKIGYVPLMRLQET